MIEATRILSYRCEECGSHWFRIEHTGRAECRDCGWETTAINWIFPEEEE